MTGTHLLSSHPSYVCVSRWSLGLAELFETLLQLAKSPGSPVLVADGMETRAMKTTASFASAHKLTGKNKSSGLLSLNWTGIVGHFTSIWTGERICSQFEDFLEMRREEVVWPTWLEANKIINNKFGIFRLGLLYWGIIWNLRQTFFIHPDLSII